MKGGPLIPLWILLGLVVFFAALIFFLLRVRKSALAQNLALRAADARLFLGDAQGSFADLLYGLLQDFSGEQGLIVRNFRDEEVGRVTFHTGARHGWVTLQIGAESYEVDVLPTVVRQTTVLHPAADSSSVLCKFQQLGRVFRFEGVAVGVLESKAPGGLFAQAPLYEYVSNGENIGASRHIGKWVNRGTCLVLLPSIPLPIRLFVMAMQRQRS